MEGQIKCPKCGSDQVLSGQCLKCGIVVAKFQRPTGESIPGAPLSFVAPQTDHQAIGSSYTIPTDAIKHQKRLMKSKIQTSLLGIAILLIIVAACFGIYRFFRFRASAFSGLYNNRSLLFAMRFPDHNSEWHHYYKDQLDRRMFDGANDAFFRGSSPSNPQIAVGVWADATAPVPERMDESTTADLQGKTEEDILAMMEKAGVDATIEDETPMRLGENDGFLMKADLVEDNKPLKAVILRAYYRNHRFTILITGTEEMIDLYKPEIDTLIKTLNFRMATV